MLNWKKHDMENAHLENDGIYYHQKMVEKAQLENAQQGKHTTWKMIEQKMYNLAKGRIYHHWKMKEKAQLENAQPGKCTPGKRQNLPPLEYDRKSTH